jgi:PAS domain-containing protein
MTPARSRHLDEAQRIAHVGSWERDIATSKLWWSDESARIMGAEPGTFGGTLDAFLAFVHPDDRHMATPTPEDLARGNRRESEYRIIRPDGTIRIIHEIAEVIRDDHGTPSADGHDQHITERAAEEDRAGGRASRRPDRRSI